MDMVRGGLSGFDFVCRVLREKPEDPIGYLLACAHDNECDFLEFKAGMELKTTSANPGETQDDLYWDYAQSVIALVNTKGGAFVIGVDDDSHKAVGLETNDPRHVIEKRGLEAYVREEIDARLNPPGLAWKSKGGVSWRLRATLAPYLDSRVVSYDGKDVVLVLVKPCAGSCVRVVREKQSERSEKMPIRRLGNIGRVQLLDFQDEWEEWESHRNQPSELIEQLLDRLERESEGATCDRMIRAYYERLAKSARSRMAAFTPLEARESNFADEPENAFFSPEAIELVEDDEAWLKGDDKDECSDAFPDGEFSEFESGCEDRGHVDGWDVSTDAPAKQGDLISILRNENRIVVSGEPGGGKTTCLQYFALQFGRCVEGAKPVLALFIPMGQWGRACSLEQMMVKISGLHPGQLSRLLAENRLRLIIDAVNECPDSLRPAAIRNICLYLQDRPGLPAVLSTRHPEELKDLGLPVFGVLPMDENHRRRYLERYLGDRKQADKLMDQILKMPGGETIAENPMLLRLVVEVYGESPSRRLPSGRAGLYRRSLQGWYRRERGKESGACLRWDVKQAIGILSELAYRSRLKGYRDIPLEFVRGLWGSDAEARVQELCQGPVVYLDEEFVRFRHETFQEYLCAEFMVASQEPLPTWSASDYARWGMPMAYAYELQSDRQKCPERLWLKAWELNPWMGVAITERSVGESIVRQAHHGALPTINGVHFESCDEFVRAGSVYVAAMAARFNPKVLMDGILGRLSQCWYRRSDAALTYLVSTTEECRSRWMEMESSQLAHLKDLRIGAAIALARSWLVLKNPREIFQYHASDSWDRWVSTPDPKLAKELVDAGIARLEDFENAKRVWVENVSLPKALLFGRRGMLDQADVASRVPQWVQSASMKQAVEMVRLGWCKRSDFAAIMPGLMKGADVRTLVSLVKEGLAFPADVHDFAIDLIQDASLQGIEELVGVGILELSECQDRLRTIKARGSAEDAVVLVRMGVAEVGEFPDRKAWWIEHATPEALTLLVKNGLASQGDVEVRIRKLISESSSSVACKMIGNRLADVSSFYDRIASWAKQEQYETVSEFVEKYGDAEVRRRMAVSVDRWKFNANATSAFGLVRDGFAVCADFNDRLPWWKETEGLKVWRDFRACGLVSAHELHCHEELCQSIAVACKAVGETSTLRGDYAEQVGTWTQTAPLSCVGQLIRSGLCKAEDFRGRREEWFSMARKDEANCIVRLYRSRVITLAEAEQLALPLVPNCSIRDAVCLCSEKILQNGAFFDRSKAWVTGVDVGDAVRLVNLGILCAEDVATRIGEWVSESTPKAASWLVRAGIVKAEAFRGRLASWKGEWTLLDAVRLINDGIVRYEDVADDIVIEEYWRKRTVRGVPRMVTVDGMEVDVAGTTAVLPMKELKTLKGQDALRIGEEYDFDLIDSTAADFVLSRWGVLKRQAMQRLEIGGVYEGVVKRIEAQGAEIALGCIGGFLHVDDMSWRRIDDPRMFLAVGQRISVKVLEKYPKRCRLSFGLKQLEPCSACTPEPLGSSDDSCLDSANVPTDSAVRSAMGRTVRVGDRLRGKVMKIVPYGVVVELAPGVQGHVHISELSWTKRVRIVSDVISIGEEVEVVVLSVDEVEKRFELSIRRAVPNPWDSILARLPIGARVKGRICNVVKYGVFVELQEDFVGLLHVSDMFLPQGVEDPKECYKQGQEIDVVVKSVDSLRQRIVLNVRG